MQEIKFYVSAAGTVGTVRDYVNAKNATAPTLVIGCPVCLKMRIFAKDEGPDPYPIANLENVASWKWVMDRDFDEETNYILSADHDEITVSSIQETFDGDPDEHDFTEFSIPISMMNTEELDTWLAKSKSQTGLIGELVGYDADGVQAFILQIEGFTVRNRITSIGDPTPVLPEYLNEAQVRALIEQMKQGPEGAQGEQGLQGDKGDTGAAAGFGTPTIAVTTGTAGSEATATIEASGEDTAKVFKFNFTIPRGEKGETGEKGEKGADGNVSFNDLTEEQKASLKGQDGTVKFDELSDAQKAQLKGDPGETGPAGPPGKDGAIGEAGAPGAAAGFGTPQVVSVETLGPEEEASVEITPQAESPDTAKIFEFKFKIPRGKQGEKGADGTGSEFSGTITTSQITDFALQLNKALDEKIEGLDGQYAQSTHTHTKSEITDLNEATESVPGLLSGTDKKTIDTLAETYAQKKHTHNSSEISNLNEKIAVLELKFAEKDHDHTVEDITDLCGEDGKIKSELLPDNIAGGAVKPDHLVLIRPRAAKGIFPVVKAYETAEFTNGGQEVCSKDSHDNVKFWNGLTLTAVGESGIPAACEGLPVDIDISSLELKSGYFVYSWEDSDGNVSDSLVLPFPSVVEPTPFTTNALAASQPGLKIRTISPRDYSMLMEDEDPFTLYFVEGQGLIFNKVKYFAEQTTQAEVAK